MSEDIIKLSLTLHQLERAVLPFLKNNITLKELISLTKLKEVEVMRALQWLENKKVLTIKKDLKELVSLDENGKEYIKEGLPERRFLVALEKPLTLNEIKKQADLNDQELNVSLGLLKKKSAIEIGKDKISITKQGKELLHKEFIEESFLKQLPLDTKDLSDEEKFAYNELKKRKEIIKTELIKSRSINLTDLGNKLLHSKLKVENVIDTLTPGVIKTQSYKNKTFRRYDIKINVPKIYPGKRHFVNQAVNYIKKIWLEMGFKEMSGNLIQSSFWNFDALFTPQDHPAREMQDTFFLNELSKLPDKALVNRVKLVHENGWTTNSRGWQYKWQEKEARKLVLRTHTTVLSALTIAKLKKTDLPAKFFSVGKVFRNETLDWKHLFEFIQVEGIVVDENANFKNLLGYLKEYYRKLGFEKIRFRPSYFPYTEESVEIEVYHPVKKQWIELGGAGIFRPEVVKPLLGKDIPVLAWGQGMERSILDYYNLKDLRDIYSNNLKQIRGIKTWLK